LFNDLFFYSILDCSSAVISFWPNNPSVLTPLEIERSEDFSISSTLQFHCFKSLAVIEEWSIEKCLNLLCSINEQIELSSSIEITVSELFVPSRTLEYGIYQIKLTVKMLVSSQLISSAVTYIKIISSPIQVNLNQYGSLMIIQGHEQTFQLDPGRFSIDPDEIYFNSSVNII
jgi:hypothetical protein